MFNLYQDTTNKQKAEQDFPVVLFVFVVQHLAAKSFLQKIGLHNNVLVLPPSISSARYFCLNDHRVHRIKEFIKNIWVMNTLVKLTE